MISSKKRAGKNSILSMKDGTNISLKEPKFRHLTYIDRNQIRLLLDIGYKPSKVAVLMKINRSTLYKELAKGRTIKNVVLSYCPDKAQKRIDSSNKGKFFKLEKESELYFFIEELIVNKKYSPAVVVQKIKERKEYFGTTLSVKTIYNYIDRRFWDSITPEHLSYKRRRKKSRFKRVPKPHKPAGLSIEKRPESVEDRNQFGHWEMDLVIGTKARGANLLVLTERKTRYEIIRKIKDKASSSVVRALNGIERQTGAEFFKKIFKTITVDNGREFSAYEDMKSSVFNTGFSRTEIYYCHPYSSFERGSNENQNRFIRRFIGRGSKIKQCKKEIAKIEHWINTYPRELLGWECSKDRWTRELKRKNIPADILKLSRSP